MRARIVGLKTSEFFIMVGYPFSLDGLDADLPKSMSGAPKVRAIQQASKGNLVERGRFIVTLDGNAVVEIVERGSYQVYWQTG